MYGVRLYSVPLEIRVKKKYKRDKPTTEEDKTNFVELSLNDEIKFGTNTMKLKKK